MVSNEEIQTYAPVVTLEDRPIFLFTGLTARQIILMAGRNILVEKTVGFTDFEVNNPGFEEVRGDARGSTHVMYRETDHGLRYFVKEGEKRVISERPTRSIRALAIGTTIDPSYAFPLPMFGINYLNFEFGIRTRSSRSFLPACSARGTFNGQSSARRRSTPASIFSRLQCRRAIGCTASVGERKDEALLTWPLSRGSISVGNTPRSRRCRASINSGSTDMCGTGRQRRRSRCRRAPPRTASAAPGNTGAPAIISCSMERGSAAPRGETGGHAAASDTHRLPHRSLLKYSASLSRDFFSGPFRRSI